VGEHRGRLVEHEEPSTTVPTLQRGGDRHHRPFHRRRRGQRLMNVDVDAEALQQRARHLLLLAP
jgi:hypothetical protein